MTARSIECTFAGLSSYIDPEVPFRIPVATVKNCWPLRGTPFLQMRPAKNEREHRVRCPETGPKNGGDSDPNFENYDLFHAQSPDTGRGVHARSWRANRDVDVRL